mgnify:CR=1 FL=1
MREIFLSDIHLGEDQDLKAYRFTLRVLRDLQPDMVFLGGDIVDCGPVSSYTRKPDKEGAFQEELDHAWAQLSDLREAVPKAKMLYLLGNHEDRLKRLILSKAPALFGLRNLGWDKMLDLGSLGIKLLPEGDPYRVGHLQHIHGHELRGSSQVSPAHQLIQKINDSVICGHHHQFSVSHKTGLNGKYYVALSNGCLSTLHPDYTFNPRWRQGFTVIDYTKSGLFGYQQVVYWSQSRKLRCFVDGKQYVS